MDSTDRKLLELLCTDGRRANVDIARQLGISEGTVRKRIDRLISSGLLSIVGVVDPPIAGYGTRVWIGLTVELARVEPVARQLCELPEVVSVQTVTGEHDIVLEAALESDEQLGMFLRERLASIPGILASKTCHVAKVHKRCYQWCPPPPPPPRVLVVDDDPDFCEFARAVLEREGYRVHTATSGDAALTQMATMRPDLVVMDIMMQGVLDGWHASWRVRSDRRLRDVPILVVSAITSSDYLAMFPTDDGSLIDGFLSKPVQPHQLISEVRRLLTRV